MNYYRRIAYDPATGVFTWAVSGRGIRKGELAGSLTCYGYWQIKLGLVSYRAQRLAWFLSHGVWPTGEIDHIDGDRLNNRLANLRDVTRAENSQNRWMAQRNNRCGLLGTCWVPHAKAWRAVIVANGITHRLGYFPSADAAHAAYMAKKAVLHAPRV